MDRYEKLDQVGEGTYGIVYRANDLLTGEIVALKRIPIKGDEVVLWWWWWCGGGGGGVGWWWGCWWKWWWWWLIDNSCVMIDEHFDQL